MESTDKNARFSDRKKGSFDVAIFAVALIVLFGLLLYALTSSAEPCKFSESLTCVDYCRALGFGHVAPGDVCLCLEEDGTIGAIPAPFYARK